MFLLPLCVSPQKRRCWVFSYKRANNLVLLPQAKWWSCFIIPPFSSVICFPPSLRVSVGSLLRASNITSSWKNCDGCSMLLFSAAAGRSCPNTYWSDGLIYKWRCHFCIRASKSDPTLVIILWSCLLAVEKSTSLFKATSHLVSCRLFKGRRNVNKTLKYDLVCERTDSQFA